MKSQNNFVGVGILYSLAVLIVRTMKTLFILALILVSVGAGMAILDESLLIDIRMNETISANTWKDFSGNNLHFTVNASASANTTNNWTSFWNTSAYVEGAVGSSVNQIGTATYPNWTIATWQYVPSTASGDIDYFAYGADFYRMVCYGQHATDGNVRCDIFNSAPTEQFFSANINAPEDEWFMFALSGRGGLIDSFIAYPNGTIVSGATFNLTTGAMRNGSSVRGHWIGNNDNQISGRRVAGYRVYNQTLNQGNLSALAARGINFNNQVYAPTTLTLTSQFNNPASYVIGPDWNNGYVFGGDNTRSPVTAANLNSWMVATNHHYERVDLFLSRLVCSNSTASNPQFRGIDCAAGTGNHQNITQIRARVQNRSAEGGKLILLMHSANHPQYLRDTSNASICNTSGDNGNGTCPATNYAQLQNHYVEVLDYVTDGGALSDNIVVECLNEPNLASFFANGISGASRLSGGYVNPVIWDMVKGFAGACHNASTQVNDSIPVILFSPADGDSAMNFLRDGNRTFGEPTHPNALSGTVGNLTVLGLQHDYAGEIGTGDFKNPWRYISGVKLPQYWGSFAGGTANALASRQHIFGTEGAGIFDSSHTNRNDPIVYFWDYMRWAVGSWYHENNARLYSLPRYQMWDGGALDWNCADAVGSALNESWCYKAAVNFSAMHKAEARTFDFVSPDDDLTVLCSNNSAGVYGCSVFNDADEEINLTWNFTGLSGVQNITVVSTGAVIPSPGSSVNFGVVEDESVFRFFVYTNETEPDLADYVIASLSGSNALFDMGGYCAVNGSLNDYYLNYTVTLNSSTYSSGRVSTAATGQSFSGIDGTETLPSGANVRYFNVTRGDYASGTVSVAHWQGGSPSFTGVIKLDFTDHYSANPDSCRGDILQFRSVSILGASVGETEFQCWNGTGWVTPAGYEDSVFSNPTQVNGFFGGGVLHLAQNVTVNWNSSYLIPVDDNFSVFTVDSSDLVRGQNWGLTCSAYDFERVQNGTASFVVGNVAPNASSVIAQSVSGGLNCSFVYADYDGDSQNGSTFRWFKNASLLSSTSQVLGSGNYSLTDQLVCEVTPRDGTNFGFAVNSSAFVVGDDLAPILTNLTIPSVGTVTETLQLTASCIDDYSIASGYPVVSWLQPNGTRSANRTMIQTSPGQYSLDWIFLQSGYYESFIAYCRDGSGNEASLSIGATLIIAENFAGQSGGGGGGSRDQVLSVGSAEFVKPASRVLTSVCTPGEPLGDFEVALYNPGVTEASYSFGLSGVRCDTPQALRVAPKATGEFLLTGCSCAADGGVVRGSLDVYDSRAPGAVVASLPIRFSASILAVLLEPSFVAASAVLLVVVGLGLVLVFKK